MWRFGDYKNYTSLDLLAAALDIPSPKSDMDGSQVSHVYYAENDLDKIVRYCERDVITTVQVLLRLTAYEIIEEEQIESLTKLKE
jgi:predicted PolB exonuclease-like 3'-5' exonuclease